MLRPCFARTGPWLQAGKYAAALMSQIPRRNWWTIAEHAGDRTPDRTQRLLSRAVWDTWAAMRVVRRFAVAGLNQAARICGRRGLAVGRSIRPARSSRVSPRVSSGTISVAPGRWLTGSPRCTWRMRARARACADRGSQWIPREHLEDPAKRQVMRLPPDLVFRTKGQLAIDLIGEVLADAVRLDVVCGDEVYGSCTQLREFLEARGQAYVLRVPSNFHLTVTAGVRLTCKDAARVRPARRWEVRSAGKGSKGERWYAWAWLATASPRHHLLIRRHLASGELAFHYCYVPKGQPVSKARLIRAAGLRWPVEECFELSNACALHCGSVPSWFLE